MTGDGSRDAVDANSAPGQLHGIVGRLAVRPTFAAPLAITGERQGVFVTCTAEPERFTEADLAFLTAAVRWVGAIARPGERAGRIAAGGRE